MPKAMNLNLILFMILTINDLEFKINTYKERACMRIGTSIDTRHPLVLTEAYLRIHSVVFSKGIEVLHLEIEACLTDIFQIDHLGEIIAHGHVGNAQIVTVLQIQVREIGPVMVVVGQTWNGIGSTLAAPALYEVSVIVARRAVTPVAVPAVGNFEVGSAAPGCGEIKLLIGETDVETEVILRNTVAQVNLVLVVD